MNEVFVDTSHIVATLHPRDQFHSKAIVLEHDLRNLPLVTSDFVLWEVLNYFSEFREFFKQRIARSVDVFMSNPRITVVESSRRRFENGFVLYKARLDKGYSLTDCVSMNIMREREIEEILTNDDHFEQEGFKTLF